MCRHQNKLLRTSMVLRKSQLIGVEVWQCEKCKKYLIINVATGSRISLNGELGEEIENNN
jgi:ribosomal protein L37AE/L43A